MLGVSSLYGFCGEGINILGGGVKNLHSYHGYGDCTHSGDTEGKDLTNNGYFRNNLVNPCMLAVLYPFCLSSNSSTSTTSCDTSTDENASSNNRSDTPETTTITETDERGRRGRNTNTTDNTSNINNNNKSHLQSSSLVPKSPSDERDTANTPTTTSVREMRMWKYDTIVADEQNETNKSIVETSNSSSGETDGEYHNNQISEKIVSPVLRETILEFGRNNSAFASYWKDPRLSCYHHENIWVCKDDDDGGGNGRGKRRRGGEGD